MADNDGMKDRLKIENKHGECLHDLHWIAGVDCNDDEDDDEHQPDDNNHDHEESPKMKTNATKWIQINWQMFWKRMKNCSDNARPIQARSTKKKKHKKSSNGQKKKMTPQDPDEEQDEEEELQSLQTCRGRTIIPRDFLTCSHLQTQGHVETKCSMMTAKVIAKAMCRSNDTCLGGHASRRRSSHFCITQAEDWHSKLD
jgi:hypothetical protein